MPRDSKTVTLKRKIKQCSQYKDRLANAVNLLAQDYSRGKITKIEYESYLSKALDGKDLDYWNNYYESLISLYSKEIKAVSRRTTLFSVYGLLLIALVSMVLLSQFTGQAVYQAYPGAAQHGYINNGGSCAYSPTGFLSATAIDDSNYFSQGPFNGVNSVFNWNSISDIIYLDIGPISQVRSEVTELNISWNGRFSKTQGTGRPPTDVAIGFYNWTGARWQQYDQGLVAQAEKTSFLRLNGQAAKSAVSNETNGFARIGFVAIGANTLCNALVLTDTVTISVRSDLVIATTTSSTTTVITTTSTTTSTTTLTSSTSTSSTTVSTTTSTSSIPTTTSTTTSLSTSTSTTSTVLPGQPGQVIVNVAATIGLTVDSVYSTVDFSTLVVDSSESSLDNLPLPLLIRNEGSVIADVQLSSSALWSSPSSLPTDFMFSISEPDPLALTLTEFGVPADFCSPIQCFNPAGTVLAATQIPINPASPINAINDLEFSDSNDEAEIDIYIHVPKDEPAGLKSSTLTIIGLDSSSF